MHRYLLTLLAALALAAAAHAGVWDTATPASTDPISQGDDRIRELKVAVQEALRGGATEGAEAVFPGGSPATAPIYRYRGLKGSTAARPAATYGGLYWNTTTGTVQRSSYTAADTGAGWEDITENAAYEAIHQKVAQSLASAAGVVTLPETANSFDVTGTEAVTSIAGWSAGVVKIKWASARILTHGASLVLKSALSRNLVANDVSVFEFTGSNAVREIAFYGAGAGLETGQVIMHAGTTCPAGTLAANGTSELRADYPGLYAVIGNAHGTADATHFNRPDLRGRFVRGYNNGAGNDPDAASRTAANTGGATGDNVGSLQADELKAHVHTAMQPANTVNADGASGGFSNSFPAQNTSSTGGNETRPKNITLLYCIKY